MAPGPGYPIALSDEMESGNHQAVFDTLVPKYGDTYMFYSLFNVCGVE